MEHERPFEFSDRDKQTINGMVGSSEVYYEAGKLTPREIRDRQIAYMTAAVLWFILACIALIAGSYVWKICLDIAAS